MGMLFVLIFFAKSKGRRRWFYHSSHQEYLLGYTLQVV